VVSPAACMALPLIMRLLSGYDRVQMIPASVDQPQHGLIAGRPHCSLKLIRGRDWFTVHSLDHIATLHFSLVQGCRLHVGHHSPLSPSEGRAAARSAV
jgi:hypothetical protein